MRAPPAQPPLEDARSDQYGRERQLEQCKDAQPRGHGEQNERYHERNRRVLEQVSPPPAEVPLPPAPLGAAHHSTLFRSGVWRA